MSWITLLNGHIARRATTDEAHLTVQAGERLGDLVDNGTGKSTPFGVLAGRSSTARLRSDARPRFVLV